MRLQEAPYNPLNNQTEDDDIDETMRSRFDDEDMGPARIKNLDEDHHADKEYRDIAWYSIKINNEDGSFNTGLFKKHLIQMPVLKPPFDDINIKEEDQVIEFVIEEFNYDIDYLKKKSKKKKKKKKKVKLNLSKRKIPKEVHDLISEKAFIQNTKKQYNDRPFEKGNGIDIYIDGCRFLPDNTKATKVRVGREQLFKIIH